MQIIYFAMGLHSINISKTRSLSVGASNYSVSKQGNATRLSTRPCNMAPAQSAGSAALLDIACITPDRKCSALNRHCFPRMCFLSTKLPAKVQLTELTDRAINFSFKSVTFSFLSVFAPVSGTLFFIAAESASLLSIPTAALSSRTYL